MQLVWSPAEGGDRIWPAWRRHFGLTGRWPGEEIGEALLNQFCGGLWVEDPDSFAALQGPALFLANHQVAIESILFAMAVTPFLSAPLHAISKAEHADSWVGQMFGQLNSWIGVKPLDSVFFYRIGDAPAMLQLMKTLNATMTERQCGLLVHVAASRVLSCRDRVRTLSSVFIDLALSLKMPIVPVKFRGGLPIEPQEGFIDFPVGYGTQDYLIGRPIPAATLAAMPYAERRALVLDRINGLGGDLDLESPSPSDPAFKSDMRGLMTRLGVLEPSLAVIWAALKRLPHPSAEIATALEAIEAGKLEIKGTLQGRWIASLVRWLTEGRIPVRVTEA